ncbi:MAG: aminopeptidase P family protein [Chloroflexi bacterium]|nr:aminopeptidase P family protein [Chloroflexota bacterium]
MERLIRLRDALDSHNLDGMLVGSSANRRYLSGFTGSDGWLIVTKQKACLAVDFRYVEQAKKESSDFESVYIKGDISSWLPEFIKNLAIKRLGIEADHLSVSTYQSICNIPPGTESQLQIIPVKSIVESLRIIKESSELEFIKKAAVIADTAMLFVSTHLRAGITEKQLSWELECFMRQDGSESMPFEIIVASGPNAALPHAQPSDKLIATGEPVTIDLGARYNGYCSDMTRTFIIGKPDSQFDNIYNIVLAAQMTGLSIIESGMVAGEADRLIRGMIDKAGYGERFGHGLGHGIGLEVHEPPRLGLQSDEILGDNMVFTIEPGIYIPGWGGVRIEDTVTLENGKLVSLTHASKEALIRGG